MVNICEPEILAETRLVVTGMLSISVSMCVAYLALASSVESGIENSRMSDERFQTRAIRPCPIPSSAGFRDQSKTFGSEMDNKEKDCSGYGPLPLTTPVTIGF